MYFCDLGASLFILRIKDQGFKVFSRNGFKVAAIMDIKPDLCR